MILLPILVGSWAGVSPSLSCPSFLHAPFVLAEIGLVFKFAFPLICSLSFVRPALTHEECLSLLKVDFSIYFSNSTTIFMKYFFVGPGPHFEIDYLPHHEKIKKAKKNPDCKHHTNCMSCFHVYRCLNIAFEYIYTHTHKHTLKIFMLQVGRI